MASSIQRHRQIKSDKKLDKKSDYETSSLERQPPPLKDNTQLMLLSRILLINDDRHMYEWDAHSTVHSGIQYGLLSSFLLLCGKKVLEH